MTEIIFEAAEKKKGGCLKVFGIGCLVVLFLGAVGGFFAYKGVKGFVTNFAGKYTSSTPVELLAVAASRDEIVDVLNRFDDFVYSLEGGQKLSELVLTSKDINIILQKHEELSEVSDVLYVNLKGDKIYADVSIPIDKFGDLSFLDGILKKRYLNGSIAFQVGMAAERLVVNVESISVDGKKVPSSLIYAINHEDIGNKLLEDKKVVDFLEKIDSIKVKDGKVYILPKKVN